MASVRKYATAKGHAWRVQYRSPDGKSRTKQGFRTKTEAQAWADINAAHIHGQDWIDPNAGKVTIGELGERWLATKNKLKPSTVEWYGHVLESGVYPAWKHTPVQTVKKSTVKEWIANYDASNAWIRHCHSVLSQVIDLAVDDRSIRENPVRGVPLPAKAKPRHVYLTMEQLVALAKECKDRKDLILLLGTSGLRWGEAIALRPMDLDPLRNRISITRNAVRVSGTFIIGTPKTHESRKVAVSDYVMKLLVERAENLASNDLLWRSARGGYLAAPGKKTWFAGALTRVQAEDELFPAITVHGLRHVAAGLLVESGANVKAVSRQLGHKSAAMTLDVYTDLFDDGLDVVAKALDKNIADIVDLSWNSA